ncbi:EamA family transporter [Candidatus Micrarchaeota archaeon]|nr:EamA family transporter [Candidatus Micrarchaeota archaeon]
MAELWIALVVASAFVHAFWNALLQKYGDNKRAATTGYLINFSVVLFLLVPLFLTRGSISLSQDALYYVALGGVLDVLVVWLLVKGLTSDYTSTYALRNASVLFQLLFGVTLLGEQVAMLAVGGIVMIAVGGILFYNISRFTLYGLALAVVSAVSAVVAKPGVMLTNPFFYQASVNLISGVVLMSFTFISARRIVAPQLDHVRGLLAMGFFVTLASSLWLFAVSLERVSYVGPASSVRIVFALLLAYFLLRERKDFGRKTIASLLVLAGVVAITLRA